MPERLSSTNYSAPQPSSQGLRLILPNESAEYTRDFITRGRNLTSTLYEVPHSSISGAYSRPGSTAILNTAIHQSATERESASNAAERSAFRKQVSSGGGRTHSFNDAQLHFKSHVADIDGARRAFITTGNLSYSSLYRSTPYADNSKGLKRKNEHYQINIGLEVTNPEIVAEVSRIQNALKKGSYIAQTKHFASGQRAAAGLRRELRESGRGDKIVLSSPYIDNTTLAKELIRAKRRGAEVSVIAAEGNPDGSPPNKARADVRQLLANGGVKVYTSDKSPLVHSKYASILRADNTAYSQVGSSNYTYASAENRTLDYMLLSKDPTLASQLLQMSGQMPKEFGLRQIRKSSDITRYDLGPLSGLLRPGYKERNLLTKGYTKVESDIAVQREGAGLAYYPTAMPQEFFQMYSGKALPQVSIYQNLYEAYTRKEAPQALKNMDAQLADMGLGNQINRLLGVNLYEPGSGIGMTLLRGVGRLLDTMFGHYSYQEYKAQQSGEYEGSLSRLDDLFYKNREMEPGFFEQSITYAGESVSRIGMSLASYFAFSHTWNITRTLFQDTGVDYLMDFNNLGTNRITDSTVQSYIGKRAFSISKRSAFLSKELSAKGADDDIFRTVLEGFGELDIDQRFGRSMDLLLRTAQDYSLLMSDKGTPVNFVTESWAVSPTAENSRMSLLSKIEDLNLFSYDRLSVHHDFASKTSIQKLSIIEGYAKTILGDLEEGSEVLSLAKTFSLTETDIRGGSILDYTHYQVYQQTRGGVASAKKMEPNITSKIRLASDQKMKRLGIDVATRQITLRPATTGSSSSGLFSMMSVSRQLEQEMFNQITLPLLDYISVVGGSRAERKLYAEGVSDLSSVIGETPVLRYGGSKGFFRPSVSAYGFDRQEALAQAYEHVAYFVPTNMLLWFRPVRDLLGIDSIATAGDVDYSYDTETGKLDSATVKAMREKLQGQSLKALIGSGFTGLIRTQKGIANNLHRLATNPSASLRDAYNFLSNDFELRVIERDLLKQTRTTLDRASKASTQLVASAEKFVDIQGSVVQGLRYITDGLYGEGKIADQVEKKVIGALEMRYKSRSLLGSRFYGRVSGARLQGTAPQTRSRSLRIVRSRAQAPDVFSTGTLAEPTYKQRYVDLIKEQELLARRTLGDDAFSSIETQGSAPFKNFRRFMMGAGLFFTADYLIDKFFLQAPGADLFAQFQADRYLEDEGERFARIQFTGNIPTAVRYPVALAGFLAGGMLFGETRRTSTFLQAAEETMSSAAAVQHRYAALAQVIPNDLAGRFDAPLLARLADVPHSRVSRRFGTVGALAGMAAALFGTQILFSSIAHVANLVGGRYKDGLHIGGMYAQFSTTLMQAVADGIESRDTAYMEGRRFQTTRQQQADLMLASLIAAEYQQSDDASPGRGIYSFAHQLNSPIFQLALVSRHDSATGTTEISAGFQFIPILAMGSTPVLPLMFRISKPKSPLESLAAQRSGSVNTSDPVLTDDIKSVGLHELLGLHIQDGFNSIMSLGFGDSLVYNPNSSVGTAMMYMGSAGIATDAVRHLGKTLPQTNFLRREIAQLGVAGEIPYHGVRLMSKLIEFSQMPLMLVPDTLAKGFRATAKGLDPKTVSGLQIKSVGAVVAVGTFFAAAPIITDVGRFLASATGIGIVAGERGETQVSDLLVGGLNTVTALGSAIFAGASVSKLRGAAGSGQLASFAKQVPSFARRAAPYYMAYAIARALTAPPEDETLGTESPGGLERAYTNLAIASVYGGLIDKAGVFRRYDDDALRNSLRNPLYRTEARRIRAGAIHQMQRISRMAYQQAAVSLGARGFEPPGVDAADDYVAQYKRLFRAERKQVVREMITNAPTHMRLSSTIGARLVMASKTMVAINFAATAIASLAPNALRSSAIMAPFRVVSGVEPYGTEADKLRDPMGMPAGKYQPTNLRDAFGVMLDFIGRALTFGKASPGTALGIYRGQPNMFINIAAGAGLTVGQDGSMRNYMQAQGVATDASFSVYSIFRGGLVSDLAVRLQSVLAANKGIDATSALNLLRGSFAKQHRSRTSRFIMHSSMGSIGASRGLMMAIRVRSAQMDNLVQQRPSEIAIDFMRMMVGAGYASDENVDLKRITGLPINYLGSLFFSVRVGGKPQIPVISKILGDYSKPDLSQHIYEQAMEGNTQLAGRVPIFSDFVDMATIVSSSWRNGNVSAFAQQAVLAASIAVPSAFMFFTTFAELTAGGIAMMRGGSQNLARKEASETLSRIRGNYIFNKQTGRKHYFARKHGQKGAFSDVTNTDVVLSPQARADELYFVMESPASASTRAATIDIRGLDIKEGQLGKFAYAATGAYSNMLSGLHDFVSNFHPDPYISDVVAEARHLDVQQISERIYSSFRGTLQAGLSASIGNFDTRLVNLLTPSDIETYMSGLLDRKNFTSELVDLFTKNNAGSLSNFTPQDAIDRAEFVRKYLASQAEGVLENVVAGLPKDTTEQIGREAGVRGLGSKVRHRVNTVQLAPISKEVIVKRTVDEIASSSAAQLIKKQGVVATLKETAGGLGTGFLKLTELSQIYSLTESFAMLGSENLVERRIASQALPVFALQVALGIAATATIQFALANPLALAAIALGGVAILTLSQSRYGSKTLNFLRENIEKPVINNLSSLIYNVSSLPVVQPVLSVLTKPFRVLLNEVISPTFTSMRARAHNNIVLSTIQEFLVPETVDSFANKQYRAPSRGTLGERQELYTMSEIRNATASTLAYRRGRIANLSFTPEEQLLHPFLQGRTTGYRESLISSRYFNSSTLSAFSNDYSMSDTLELAVSRRQAVIDMTVYGRFTQRPDETFPVIGDDLALMTAAFRANRVKGGSPFALNKVIAELRAFLTSPIFKRIGKVFDTVRERSGSFYNSAMSLMDFRITTPKGDWGERIYKGTAKGSGRVYTNLATDYPKVTTMMTGVYNRSINQLFKTIKDGGLKAAVGKLITKVNPISVLKTGVGMSIGMNVGAGIGAAIGGIFGLDQAGALVGALGGTVFGAVAIHKPLRTIDALRGGIVGTVGMTMRTGNRIGSLTRFARPGQTIANLEEAANASAAKGASDVVDATVQNADNNIGRYLTVPASRAFQYGSARLQAAQASVMSFNSAAIVRAQRIAARTGAKIAPRMSIIKESMRRAMPGISQAATGVTTLFDIANLTYNTGRVLSLKGRDARREYDAAYKGLAQASVTITAGSLSAMVMRGRFAALKIIALSILANETLGKGIGDFLSDRAYDDLLKANEGRAYYERTKYNHFSTADLLGYGLAGVATVSTLAELSTTPAGKLLGRVGGNVGSRVSSSVSSVLSRSAAGRSVLSGLNATSGTVGRYSSVLSRNASSTVTAAGRLIPTVQIPNAINQIGTRISSITAGVPSSPSTVPAIAANAADDAAIAASSTIGATLRSGARTVLTKGLQAAGIAAMLVAPAMAAVGQQSAISQMTSGQSNVRRLRGNLVDIFASPTSQGAGLIGAAVGGILGPLGALAGGITGNIIGDQIGQRMAAHNYGRARQAGMTSGSEIKQMGQAIRAGSIAGGLAGGALGVAAVAGAVALGIIAAPITAVLAVGALAVGGAALLGSVVGAQLGFDSSLTNKQSQSRQRRRGQTSGRVYNATTKSFESMGASPASRRLSYENRRSETREEESTGHYLSQASTVRQMVRNGVASPTSTKGRTTIDYIDKSRRQVNTSPYGKDVTEGFTGVPVDEQQSNPLASVGRKISDFFLGAPAKAATIDNSSTTLQVNGMRALPRANKTLQDPKQVLASEKSRVNALIGSSPLNARTKTEIYKERTSTEVRTPDKPKGIFDQFKQLGRSILDTVKSGADWIAGSVRNLFASVGNMFKKVAQSISGVAASAAGADGTNPIDKRLQESKADLFAAVGLKPPSSFAGVGSDPRAQAIAKAAANLGVSAYDLATIIAFESNFDHKIWGGAGGGYYGLIQFGGPERAAHGVHSGQTFEQQMVSVESFMRERGVKAGHGIQEMYLAVLTGHASNTHMLHSPDSFGTTVATAVQRYFAEGSTDRQEARAFLAQGGIVDQPSQANNAQGTGQINLKRLTEIIRGDTQLISELMLGVAGGSSSGVGQTRTGTRLLSTNGSSPDRVLSANASASDMYAHHRTYETEFGIPRDYVLTPDINNPSADRNAPIYSPVRARVRNAYNISGYGNTVELEDMQGRPLARFAHLESMAVKTGQIIEPGALIGGQGATGGDYAVHLHLEGTNAFHETYARSTVTGRFGNSVSTSTQPSSNAANTNYTQAYNRAMGTMDGRHYIGARFEEIIVKRLKEAGVPQERINQAKEQIRKFNQSLPEEERSRATQLMNQGRDPNYLDTLPVDNLNQAQDVVRTGNMPRPRVNSSGRAASNGHGHDHDHGHGHGHDHSGHNHATLNPEQRDAIAAVVATATTEAISTQRRTEAYQMANAAAARREEVEREATASVAVAVAPRPPLHPENQVAAAADPLIKRGQHDIQRVAVASSSIDYTTGRTVTHLSVEQFDTEADRAAVSANGQRLPDPYMSLVEPVNA